MTDASYNTWLFMLHNKINAAAYRAKISEQKSFYYKSRYGERLPPLKPTCTPCDCFWTKTRHYNRHPDMGNVKNILCRNKGNNTGNIFRYQDKS